MSDPTFPCLVVSHLSHRLHLCIEKGVIEETLELRFAFDNLFQKIYFLYLRLPLLFWIEFENF
jgi:hypothetical protein